MEKLQLNKINKEDLNKLKKAFAESQTIIIGAGAGLSTSAGYYYSGERFARYFFDFIKKYNFKDMYTAGFYHFLTPEEFWAYWSRYIYINRYTKIPLPTYDNLLKLVKDKNYFVITTNVDHCFQKANFDKQRLFYTQGDYGLLQCKKPCKQKTYDNKNIIIQLLLDQGFKIREDGELIIDDINKITMKVNTKNIPKCPDCGGEMTTNLRADDKFVEDEGWHIAAHRYQNFLENNRNKKCLFFELGVGMNTPAIIKFPFMKYCYTWPDATYCCINYGEAFAPEELEDKSILFNADINKIIDKL